jgi:hypothetical protein
MFRFTIRDVLLLTVIAALALGWWNDRRKLAALLEQVSSEVKVPPRHGTSQGP